MSHWSLVVWEYGGEGVPHVKAIRSLSGDEHEGLSTANEAFRRILGQTTWSIVQYNYSCVVLLERQIIQNLTSRSSVRNEPEAYQVPIMASVLNFLAAMRMFLDQSEGELKRLDKADNGSRYSLWHRACTSEYDDYFAYRFLYKFRNYVQHVGLPLSSGSISVSLAHPEEVARRVRAGETAQDDQSADAMVVKILLGESPTDLVRNYDSWSASVRADLQSLTTEIDLSEQIHVVMECLARVARAYQEQFAGELSVGVRTFKEILGDLADYPSRPQLAKIEPDGRLIGMQLQKLEIERFLQAEGLVSELDGRTKQ